MQLAKNLKCRSCHSRTTGSKEKVGDLAFCQVAQKGKGLNEAVILNCQWLESNQRLPITSLSPITRYPLCTIQPEGLEPLRTERWRSTSELHWHFSMRQGRLLDKVGPGDALSPLTSIIIAYL